VPMASARIMANTFFFIIFTLLKVNKK
jgi:hypothetical protein